LALPFEENATLPIGCGGISDEIEVATEPSSSGPTPPMLASLQAPFVLHPVNGTVPSLCKGAVAIHDIRLIGFRFR